VDPKPVHNEGRLHKFLVGDPGAALKCEDMWNSMEDIFDEGKSKQDATVVPTVWDNPSLPSQ
jgi:hypothetical protein